MHREYKECCVQSRDGLRLYVRDYAHPEADLNLMCLYGFTRTIEVANRGHAPILDEPEALRAINAFLSQLRAGRTKSG